ncbi:anti-repressor SinI family protein [Ammoniphilus sp. CFH 90114]|uniref:anti-repressor SinI family protein n=1 Tax=Ammoniphilus sp. CFH 90114 TaxID=2493665 RepID=UPI00100EF6F0|nr:anti-repressor SinI family protein [Ammoniphilus sp. CFH 90114]RXT01535.1 DNA-binding anti-repressor SinI [Ammoniphilus sp. CFH 90114]
MTTEDRMIDLDWLALIQEAKEIGLRPEEIRRFLSTGVFLAESDRKNELKIMSSVNP